MNRPSSSTYDPRFFERLQAAEERHFWFLSRSRLIARLAEQLVSTLRPGYRVLEVGCGNGNVLGSLKPACARGTLVGLDFYLEGLRIARRRVACPLVRGDLDRPPFDRAFHLVGMFDVLEHFPDDRGVLRQVSGLLVPGGRLLLTVPAHQWLWSYADVAAGHQRRYTESSLRETIAGAGLHTEFVSPFMSASLPLLWFWRRLGGRRRAQGAAARTAEEFHVVPVLNELLSLLTRWEPGRIAARHPLPFGSSLVAIAGVPEQA